MPDTGESSSGDGARAMEDHDAQVARRMQDMLDEEASLEAVSKLRIKEERTSYRKNKGMEMEHEFSKGKGRARGYDDDDGNGNGRPPRSRRVDAVNYSGTCDDATSVVNGRGKSREIEPATSRDPSHTSNSAYVGSTGSKREHLQQLQDSLDMSQMSLIPEPIPGSQDLGWKMGRSCRTKVGKTSKQFDQRHQVRQTRLWSRYMSWLWRGTENRDQHMRSGQPPAGLVLR